MNKPYFDSLSNALNEAKIAYPVLVIDKAKLDANIECLKRTLAQGFDYRIVAKSIPSVPLIRYVMQQTESGRLMCFHLPFLQHLLQSSLPIEDILLGKPMPANAMEGFYRWFSSVSHTLKFDPEFQLQWLVDSHSRLLQYENVAKNLKLKLRINLEIDVGLHRGGYQRGAEFSKSLEYIQQSDFLCLSGLMGYEAHVSKIPLVFGGTKVAEYRTKKLYEGFVNDVEAVTGSIENLCLNTGGSTTYPLYKGGDCASELSVASALVKPSDFDVHTLSDHQPAAFIATPVLKVIDQPELPLIKPVSKAMRAAGRLPERAAFIYGGNWLAKPCWPEASSKVTLFGASSNQEMYSIPSDSQIQVDDYFFLRPTQSEAVFLQFGQIALFEKGELDKGKIVDWWPVFEYPNISSKEGASSCR